MAVYLNNFTLICKKRLFRRSYYNKVILDKKYDAGGLMGGPTCLRGARTTSGDTLGQLQMGPPAGSTNSATTHPPPAPPLLGARITVRGA